MKTKDRIKHLLYEPIHTSEKFHSQTKIRNLNPVLDEKDWPQAWKTIYFKDYLRLDKIVLPDPEVIKKTNILEILKERSSDRNFSSKPLTLEQLSSLLFYSSGLRSYKFKNLHNRFYPSPGGRYPLEVYIISMNSELPRGVYHYNLRSHSLEILLQSKKIDLSEYFNQKWIENAGMIVVFTAMFERTTMKYGDRGYRHVISETGHLGQNFYLLCTALDIICCAIGGYIEEKLEKLLDINGISESVVYTLAVGTKVKSK